MVRKIKVSPGIGTSSLLIQHSELLTSDIFVDKPELILILQGHSTLRHGMQESRIQSGEMLAVNSGHSLSITNVPSDEGIFSCAIMAWDSSLFCDSRLYVSPFEGVLTTVEDIRVIPHIPPAFRQSFTDTHHSMMWHKSLPPTIARHRMIEQLLWLSHLGISYSRQHSESITQQVRDLLVNNLHKSFTAAEVAEKLMMNEVMLRRRLATENSVLRNLMIDVRMTHALRLLQCTDLAISHIAHQVGYESSSRFAERFRKRFGFAPTSIRGHLRSL
ncbi:MAG: helix-turn-helix transcriptional regulator [Ewingella sp.]|jgi:AraC-like DNA-binding protein|uniref:helix-turn-helix transcriptional regulator n=1 Tax=Ewingella TaxID=41201 RepID=UPI001838209C|nr:helix-turn-helix transcriptional regulator [Pseudomonas reactans]